MDEKIRFKGEKVEGGRGKRKVERVGERSITVLFWPLVITFLKLTKVVT